MNARHLSLFILLLMFSKALFEISWNGRGANDAKLPTGVYLLKFSAKDVQNTRRVILY